MDGLEPTEDATYFTVKKTYGNGTVALNPTWNAILDGVAVKTGISRVRIVRMGIKAMAERLNCEALIKDAKV